MSGPEPRVVGQVLAGDHLILGPIWTTQVECPICYALLAGDRQEQHKQWHADTDMPEALRGAAERFRFGKQRA